MTRAHASPLALALLLALPLACKKSGESAAPTEASDDDDDDDRGGDDDDDDAAEATLNHSTFEEIVGDHMGEVSECFSAAAEATPGLAGTLSLTFSIQGDGTVESTSVAEGSTLTDAGFVECVQGKVAGWRFPKTPSGEPMTLTFPFKLKAS
ncbi:MAG: AgmX/PglI C-terminal domain-containing protein [Nannocystaceae bacterium]